MTCCGGDLARDNVNASTNACDIVRAEELLHAGRDLGDGRTQYVFSAPAIHCGTCLVTIERGLSAMSGIESVRANLSLKRITLTLRDAETDPLTVANELDRLGFPVQPVDLGDLEDVNAKRQDKEMLKALAVAGFASSNIMLLSVSIWSGAEGSTRDLFHLISALIAIPAVIYSGRIFLRSAWGALKNGRVNMDVPISLAILLATGMSLFEALTGGENAYFEASTMLLFFLLIGRYLDQRMRERVRNAVVQLSRLTPRGANCLVDGDLTYLPIDEVTPGMVMRVRAGERIPLDGKVISGRSDVDRSLVNGESAPVLVEKGMALEAGAINLTGMIDLEVTSTADTSFLAEVRHMIDAAENGRGNYTRIADRMARLYAPFVHSLAALAFLGWMIWTGGDWKTSLYIAISLLIITCPCALGLAVPVVHVLAATRLFERGILMKDGAALERLAEADYALFDKTGTLTTGTPLVETSEIETSWEKRAATTLAAASAHPASRALATWLGSQSEAEATDLTETSGMGVQATFKGRIARLGRADWVAEIAIPDGNARQSGLSFAFAGEKARHITLSEDLRPGAATIAKQLADKDITSEILSGDALPAVASIASRTGINSFKGACRPADKIARVEELKAEGKLPLFIGDGINDAPALAAAHVSMAPSSGSDVGRMAADFVLTRDNLSSVDTARQISLRARALVKQNFALATVYNLIAVPIAVMGFVTPLVAALAMSASSIIVVLNSMRLNFDRTEASNVNQMDTRSQAVPMAMEPAE